MVHSSTKRLLSGPLAMSLLVDHVERTTAETASHACITVQNSNGSVQCLDSEPCIMHRESRT